MWNRSNKVIMFGQCRDWSEVACQVVACQQVYPAKPFSIVEFPFWPALAKRNYVYLRQNFTAKSLFVWFTRVYTARAPIYAALHDLLCTIFYGNAEIRYFIISMQITQRFQQPFICLIWLNSVSSNSHTCVIVSLFSGCYLLMSVR